MSDLTTKAENKTFFAKYARAIRFWVGLISSYCGMKFTVVAAFASAYNPSSRTSGDTAGSTSFGARVFGFLAPLQDFSTVILILCAVICGMKIGASSITGDSRNRTNSLVGLFFIVFGELVVIHAQSIVGLATGISTNGSTQ